MKTPLFVTLITALTAQPAMAATIIRANSPNANGMGGTNTLVPANWASNVALEVPGNAVFETKDGADGVVGTPNIELTWSAANISTRPGWEFHSWSGATVANTDGGALQIDGTQFDSVFSILFTPDNPTVAVILNGFNFVGDTNNGHDYGYRVDVVDLLADTVEKTVTTPVWRTDTSLNPDNSATWAGAPGVDLDFTGDPGRAYRIDIVRIVGSGTAGWVDMAIDNISFDQTAAVVPEVVEAPAGPASVTALTADDFTITANDPDEQDVEVQIDWGDGRRSEWSSAVVSGSPVVFNHAYPHSGEFTILARVRNAAGSKSDWVVLQSISVAAASGDRDGLVGLWEFDDANDLGKATIGEDLTIAGDEPDFEASLSDGRAEPVTLGGVIRTVAGPGNHLVVPHLIGANGYGERSNVFTFVYDVLAPLPTAQWHAFYQTDLTNTADAEFFMRANTFGGSPPDSIGRGGLGYSSTPLARDRWHRLAIVMDLTPGGFVRTYVDGVIFHNYTVPSLDSRFSLAPSEVLFFADENNENQSLAVGMAAVFSKALDEAELLALGAAGAPVIVAGSSAPPEVADAAAGPGAVTALDSESFSVTATDPDDRDVEVQIDWGDGRISDWSAATASGTAVIQSHAYPHSGSFEIRARARNSDGFVSDWVVLQSIEVAPAPGIRDGLSGLWLFEDPADIGKASFGEDFLVAGDAPQHFASFAERAVFPRELENVIFTAPGVGNHLVVPHGVGANGYGTRANSFTLVYDVLMPSPRQWHAFYQTDLTNTADAEFFMRPADDGIGRGDITYSAPVARDRWHRLVVSVDLTEGGFIRSYLNGQLHHQHSKPSLDSRWSLDPAEVLMFADENNENQPLAVAAMAVFSKALDPDEAAALGLPGTTFFPAETNDPPSLAAVAPPEEVPAGQWTEFTFEVSDPDGDAVQIQIEWDDGRFSDWTDFVPDGGTVTLSHAFVEAFDYDVWGRARDVNGAVSDWFPLAFVDALPTPNPPREDGNLKVISYNVYNHFNNNRQSLEETVGWLRGQNADVIALQEMIDIDSAMFAEYALAWGHEHALLDRESGRTKGLSSRFPITDVVRHTDGFDRRVLQAKTGGYHVFVVHKNPSSRAARLADLALISPVIEAALADPDPVIVLGDFNAQSESDDAFLAGQTDLLASLPASDLNDGYFDFDVMNGFLALGLADPSVIPGPASTTFPSLLRLVHRPESFQAGRLYRIDYILVDTTSASGTTIRYPRDRILDYTSDHYPVVAMIGDAPAPGDDYAEWAAEFPGLADSDPLADPDQDGVVNLFEYILGGDPTQPGTAGMPVVSREANGDLVFSFVRRGASKDASEQVFQYSHDLNTWVDVPIPAASAGNIQVLQDEPSAGQGTVVITVDASEAESGRLFGRLRASASPNP